jgi:hypothetical protein
MQFVRKNVLRMSDDEIEMIEQENQEEPPPQLQAPEGEAQQPPQAPDQEQPQ